MNKPIKKILLLSLLLSFWSGHASSQIVTQGIQIVFVKINSFQEFKEMQQAIEKIEGIHALVPLSEVPGLLTFGVDYAGGPEELTQKLEQVLSRYKITRRTLPTGVSEINISKG